MPLREFLGWQAYFSIYPFTFERDNWRHAELLSAILNDGLASRAQAAGRTSFKPIDALQFVPDYLGERVKKITDPLQKDEYAAFAAKLKAAQGKTNGTG